MEAPNGEKREKEDEVEEAIRDFVVFWPLISLCCFCCKKTNHYALCLS